MPTRAAVSRSNSLPTIVRFIGTSDAPGSSCPHCGANGRRVHRFLVSDGRTLGAMSGCVKLFPVAPIAREDMRLRDKEARYALNGWRLGRDDQAARDAIRAFYDGHGSELAAMDAVQLARSASRARMGVR